MGMGSPANSLEVRVGREGRGQWRAEPFCLAASALPCYSGPGWPTAVPLLGQSEPTVFSDFQTASQNTGGTGARTTGQANPRKPK